MYSKLYKLLTAVTILSLSAGAHAEEENQVRILDEIVVTAHFRDTSLMETAGSVSVVQDTTIFDRGGQHLEEVLNVLPNVNFSSGASRARFIQVRGIGDLEQFVDPKYFPSVGVTVDDVYMNGMAGSAVTMDVQQIEVLRGPQGTRYGTNALAGMVNIRSNEPTREYSGYTEAGIGDRNAWNLGAALSGPLTKSLLGRLAIRQNKSDGFIKNDYLQGDATTNRDELSMRAKLRWLADENNFLDLTAFYVDVDNGYDAFSLDNTRHTLSDEPGKDTQKSLALAADGHWAFSERTAVEAILTANDSDSEYSYDEDWTHLDICQPGLCFPYANTDKQERDRRNLSLDLRLLSVDEETLNWVAGVYAQRRSEDFARQYYGDFSSDYETDRYAVYGQLDYAWSDDWRLVTGLRYEKFSDDYADTNSMSSDSDDGYWTGEISLQYFFNAATMLYGTISRGAKPGGVNTEASSTFFFMDPKYQSFMTSRLRFGTETLLNKEIGLKGAYFDNSVSVRATLFHMDRDDAQLESWIWDDINFLWVGYLDSVSDGENYGAELELNYSPISAIDLFANVGWLNTRVDEMTVVDLGGLGQPTNSTLSSIAGRDQTKAPRWQYNLGSDLQFTQNLSARIEVEGRTEHYFGYYHNQKLDGYALLNASLGYRAGAVNIRVWARNLTDKDYAVHGLYFGNDPRKDYINESYHQYGEPRVVGVNVKYDF